MAIELLDAGSDRIDCSDIAVIDYLTEITIAVTIDTTASISDDERLASKWGGSNGTRCFLVNTADTDEIGFVVTSSGASGTFYGKKTTDSPATTSTLLRIVCRWNYNGGSPLLDISVNGASSSLTSWFSNTCTSLNDASSAVQFAHETVGANAGLDGDYSEMAIWDHYIPDWMAVGYGKGLSPGHYGKGGILYVRGANTSDLMDRWGKNTITNSGGANAAHPGVIYPRRRHIITAPVVAAGYTLPAAQGSYTLTGQSVGLKATRKITAAQGSYSLTGQSANLEHGRRLAAAQGSYALTGQAAALKADRTMAAAQGSYTLSGQDVTLTYTPLGGYTLTAAQGSYTLTGQTVALTIARALSAAQGSYTLTGQTVGLLHGRKIAASYGSYSLSGQAAGLKIARLLTADSGIYVYTGQAAGLVYSAPVAYLSGVPSWDVPTRGIEWDVPDRPIIWDVPNRDD